MTDKDPTPIWLSAAPFLLTCLLLAQKIFPPPITSRNMIKTEADYDFIIVGGGSLVCVLVNRLSEYPNIKVLVLERQRPM